MKRRQFLTKSALVSCTPLVPGFLQTTKGLTTEHSRSGKTLIVVQLAGGNDGLNTLVPYGDDDYYRNRPTLGIGTGQLIKLDQFLGFNEALKPLMSLYERAEMTVLNAVGYPNPNRSHFRSMDIWQTGSHADQLLTNGWLGRYLDSECTGCHHPYHAIEMGDNLSLALQGEKRKGFAMRGLQKLKRTANNTFLQAMGAAYVPTGNEESPLDFLYKTMVEVQESAAYILEKAKKSYAGTGYPDHPFGKGLRQIADLMLADCDTRIYYIQLPGFDTHVNQKARQARLLRIYAEGLNALIRDLKEHGLFQDTLIMTFSEFGRRIEQNASDGTDHGAANNLYLMGGALKTPGIYNDHPNLSQPQNGDLAYEIDFRSVYANILEEWLSADASAILPANTGKIRAI